MNTPTLGRIVAGGPPMLYTTRKLANGLFLFQRRHESNWGRQSSGWTIHAEEPGKGRHVPSLGWQPTLKQAIETAGKIRA